MSNYNLDYEVNFSYPTVAPTADPWLMVSEFDAWPLGQQQEASEADYLVRRRDGRSMAILKHDVVVALSACNQLRPIDEHIDAIGEQLPHLQPYRDNIRQVLSALQQQGLLISADDLLHTLTATPTTTTSATGMHTLYIRTCGRRNALARLLTQLASNPHRAQRLQRYVVLDDSPDPDTQDFVRTLVEKHRAANGLPLIYFGSTARQRLTDWLAQQLAIDPQTLHWLWSNAAADQDPGYGIGLNLALALSAGHHFALIDDDAVPVAYLSPLSQGGMHFRSGDTQVRCFTQAVWQQQPALGLDPIHTHGDYLGQLGGHFCPSTTGAAQLFHQLNPVDLHRLQANSTVKISLNGVYGDPGTNGMHWVFYTDPEGMADLTQDATTYPLRLSGQHVWKGQTRLTLSPVNSRPLMTTTLTGIDNSTLLLPTLPQGRQEDTVFGTLIAVLYPHALQLEAPWALLHLPEEPRPWSREQLDAPENLRENAYLARQLYAAGLSALSSDPAQKIQALRTKLADLAASDPSVLQADLERTLIGQRSLRVKALNDKLQQHPDAPEFWQNDVRRIIQANIGLRPEDAAQLNHQAALIRHRAAHFAAALAIWPQVWALCQATGEAELLAIATTP